MGDGRRGDIRHRRFFRVHKVCIQTRHYRFRQRITDQCISSRTGKTDQFFRQYRNGRHFRMTEGDGFKIKLRQGFCLTLTHPAGSTAGHLGVHTDIERHLTKCRDPALTKSPDNGLRTQVINKVLCVFLIFRQAACPLRIRGGSCPHRRFQNMVQTAVIRILTTGHLQGLRADAFSRSQRFGKAGEANPLIQFLLHTDHRRRSHRGHIPVTGLFHRLRRGGLTGFQFTQALQVRIHLTDFRCGVVVMLFLLHIQRAPFLCGFGHDLLKGGCQRCTLVFKTFNLFANIHYGLFLMKNGC